MPQRRSLKAALEARIAQLVERCAELKKDSEERERRHRCSLKDQKDDTKLRLDDLRHSANKELRSTQKELDSHKKRTEHELTQMQKNFDDAKKSEDDLTLLLDKSVECNRIESQKAAEDKLRMQHEINELTLSQKEAKGPSSELLLNYFNTLETLGTKMVVLFLKSLGFTGSLTTVGYALFKSGLFPKCPCTFKGMEACSTDIVPDCSLAFYAAQQWWHVIPRDGFFCAFLKLLSQLIELNVHVYTGGGIGLGFLVGYLPQLRGLFSVLHEKVSALFTWFNTTANKSAIDCLQKDLETQKTVIDSLKSQLATWKGNSAELNELRGHYYRHRDGEQQECENFLQDQEEIDKLKMQKEKLEEQLKNFENFAEGIRTENAEDFSDAEDFPLSDKELAKQIEELGQKNEQLENSHETQQLLLQQQQSCGTDDGRKRKHPLTRSETRSKRKRVQKS